MTVIFYAAMHRVQALLHHLGHRDEDCSSHGKTKGLLIDDPTLRREGALRTDYKDLLNDSWEARYNMRRFSETELTELRARYENVKQRVKELMV